VQKFQIEILGEVCMLIDLFNKQPYDSEPELEDEDFQEQINNHIQYHYYNMHAKNIVSKQKVQETSINKENKSK
jgi:hypothetical protein